MSDITITKGSTYRDTVRWATGSCVLKACTVAATVPVQITCAGHGLVDGWYIRVENCANINPKTAYPVRVVDADTLEVPCLNGARFTAGSAQLRYNAPTDLAGYSGRMQVRTKLGGPLIVELTTENGRIVIDNGAKTITREIPAEVTAAIAVKSGVFDLEMVQGDYVVKIDSGAVTVEGEATV